jgi:hypothetical protein
MFRWLRSRRRGYDPGAMPALERVIAQAYHDHLADQSWGCVALLDLVARIQQAHPEMSQTAAITRAMAIIERVRRADGVG